MEAPILVLKDLKTYIQKRNWQSEASKKNERNKDWTH